MWQCVHEAQATTHPAFSRQSFFFVVGFFFSFFALSMPCSLWDLSSLTRNRTQAFVGESAESEPLHHQETSQTVLLMLTLLPLVASHFKICGVLKTVP